MKFYRPIRSGREARKSKSPRIFDGGGGGRFIFGSARSERESGSPRPPCEVTERKSRVGGDSAGVHAGKPVSRFDVPAKKKKKKEDRGKGGSGMNPSCRTDARTGDRSAITSWNRVAVGRGGVVGATRFHGHGFPRIYESNECNEIPRQINKSGRWQAGLPQLVGSESREKTIDRSSSRFRTRTRIFFSPRDI